MKLFSRILLVALIFTGTFVSAKKIEITLSKVVVQKGQVEIKMPSHFSALLDHEKKLYYEGRKDLKTAYGDSLRECRLAFYVERYDKTNDPGLGALKAEVLNGFLKEDLKLKELSNGITAVGDREMAYLGILHKSPRKYFRFYFLTVHRELVIAGELVCPKNVHKSWIPVSEEIMKSLDLK